MLQLLGASHNLRSTQIVGGSVACGTGGPYTTDFTLSTPLVDINKALVLPLLGGTSFKGYSASGDYYRWSLTAPNNLRVEVLRSEFTSLPKQFWLVVEYLACRGRASAATNITGTAAADFDVTISPPAGARLDRAIPALTCVPLDYLGNNMRVGLSMPAVNTVRFGFGGSTGNTSKPVQADVMFF
ncbi:MAG: hypothetical protein ACOZHQ_09495 [Thermodesulfobacteriota bacterium]